eukprot:TRINITY_DN679_c1_g1_i1.p1 TRINITY_DN679_c1_g1~~TRINITY_DN679_c1_g1_i1.p1  ORF type:complete len:1130 (-),score=307.26 TRINITY_DN679_c1_g1_i1:3131-6520(-)
MHPRSSSRLCLLGSFLLFVLLNTLLTLSHAHTLDTPVICAGFAVVDGHHLGPGIDLSKVSVKMIQAETLAVMDQISCAPNGYFSFALFDSDTEHFIFRVYGPKEWDFDTLEKEVRLEECANKDIIFHIEGLRAHGKVTCEGGCGVSGATIRFGDFDAVTNEKGEFELHRLAFGEYIAAVEKRGLEFDKPHISVVLDSESAKHPILFAGHGMMVSGRIVSAKGSPLSFVPVLLEGTSFHAETGPNGRFAIQNVPCGEYVLRVVDRDARVKVEITNDNVILGDVRVMHFEVRGRITPAIGGVDILCDGVSCATTHPDGSYSIRDREPGDLKHVTAKLDGYLFSPARETGSSGILGDIHIEKVHICGQVDVTDCQDVQIDVLDDGSVSESMQVRVGSHGQFCEFVPHHSFVRVSASDVYYESKDIEIKGSPVLGVTLPRHNYRVSVSVIGSSDVDIVLSRKNQKDCLTDCTFHQRTVNGVAQFQGLKPNVAYVSSAQSDILCFIPGESEVILTPAEKETNIVFEPRFHAFSFLTHLKGVWLHEEEMNIDFFLESARTKICLPSSAKLVPGSQSRYRFPRIQLDGDGDHEVLIDSYVTDVLIDGKLDVSKLGIDEKVVAKLPERLSIVLRSEEVVDDVDEDNVLCMPLAYDENDNCLCFSSWIPIQSDDLFIHFSDKNDELYAFNPPCKVSIKIGHTQHALHFESVVEHAMFVSGCVNVPITDVHVLDNESGRETMTGSDGCYLLGPFPPQHQIDLVASAPGYRLTIQPVFLSEKDARIHVMNMIAERLIRCTFNVGVDGAVLSLSGGNSGFRSNEIVQSSDMSLTYDLPPGVYYARPMMREYEFSPATITVDLTDAGLQTKEITFANKRTAFSVFGKAVRVDGSIPSSPIKIVGANEPVSVDGNGQFRLRGIAPGSKVSLKVDGEDVVASIPSSIDLQMKIGDHHDVVFVVFERDTEKPRRVSVSGKVVGDAMDQLDRFSVRLIDANSGVVVARSHCIASPFFIFEHTCVIGKEYILQIDTDGFNPMEYSAVASEKRFRVADEHDVENVELSLVVSPVVAADSAQGVLLGLILIAVPIALFFQKELRVLGLHLWAFVQKARGREDQQAPSLSRRKRKQMEKEKEKERQRRGM